MRWLDGITDVMDMNLSKPQSMAGYIGSSDGNLRIGIDLHSGTSMTSNTIDVRPDATMFIKPISFNSASVKATTRKNLDVYSKAETDAAIAEATEGKFLTEESDPTVPAWAKEKSKPTYTADEVGAVSKEELPAAVEEALAQAKESGEFDGKDGTKGDKGDKGDRGDPGVHIDNEEPTDPSVNVWIDSDGEPDPLLLYTKQELTEEQKTQARNNIGAASVDVVTLLDAKIDEKTTVASSVDEDGTLAVSGAAVAAYVKSYMAQFPSYEEVAF